MILKIGLQIIKIVSLIMFSVHFIASLINEFFPPVLDRILHILNWPWSENTIWVFMFIWGVLFGFAEMAIRRISK
jgi:hypothetical protein